ncbi:MAG: phage holin family protein [Rhodoferax sp.]
MLPAPEPQNPALLDEAKSLWLELIALVHDRLELAALETQHAGRSLVVMVATGVMVALLIVSAWLGLLSAAILWLVHIGFMTSLAILLAVVVNLLLAALLYQSIRYQSRHLGWPATLRSFHPSARVKGNDNGGP